MHLGCVRDFVEKVALFADVGVRGFGRALLLCGATAAACVARGEHVGCPWDVLGMSRNEAVDVAPT